MQFLPNLDSHGRDRQRPGSNSRHLKPRRARSTFNRFIIVIGFSLPYACIHTLEIYFEIIFKYPATATVFPLTEPQGLYCFDEALTWGSICGASSIYGGGGSIFTRCSADHPT